MADEITAKHLAVMRIRGAPATVPGVGATVGEYPPVQVLRSAIRVLAKPLEQPLAFDKLKATVDELRAVQKKQGLGVAGTPILVVLDDPMEVVPHKRKLEVALPVRGPAKEEGDIKPGRIEGGFFVSSRVVGSIAELEKAYTYLLGRFFPARQWELARKQILNILPEDLDTAHEKSLSIEVCVPGSMRMDAQQEPEPNAPTG